MQIVSHLNASNEYGGLHAEPAIRDWARTDKIAAKALRKVEKLRVDFVVELFVSCGFSLAEARLRAELFYSGFLGLQAMAAIAPIEIE